MVEWEKMPPDDKKIMLKCTKETIHSGHFMVSEIDDNEVVEEIHSPSVVHESDCDQEPPNDFVPVPKETKMEIYTFGPRSSHSISIEVSLTQLFQCMTLAYSGKLTSPRWKTFKGLKLRLKDKIRLNNIIWRAWHIQFISKRKPPVCQFASPLDSDTHKKPEVMVVEENLWKSKVTAITAEYKKRRMYFKDRFRAKQRKSSADTTVMAMDLDARWSPWSNSNLSTGLGGIDDDLFMDTIFSSLIPSQPFDIPNHREIAAKAGIADFIQPGLAQLQPSLDDFMDTFEPLQDFLSTRLPTLIEEGPEQNVLDVLSLGHHQASTPSYGNSSAQSKQFGMTDISQNVSCEGSYSLDGSSFSVHQQNTSSNLLTNALECSNISNINSQTNVDSLPLNISSGQSVLQNSVAPVVNSITSSELNMTVSLHQSLKTDQNRESSLVSFESLSAPISSEKHSTEQSMPDFSSTLELVTQNCEQQPSFHVNDQLSSNLPSQVPMSMISQVRTQQRDRFNNNKTSRSSPQSSSPSVSCNTGANNINYQTPVHLANAVPLQMPLTTQSHIGLNTVDVSTMIAVKSESLAHKIGTTRNSKTATNTNELSNNRRHSYTGMVGHDSVNRRGNNSRNRTSLSNLTNVSTVTSEARFAVPELPVKQTRVRSRSVSSPQSGSVKSTPKQPSSSISLTNINVSPPPVSHFAIAGDTSLLVSKNSFVPNTLTSRTTPTVLPQNAVLAQLLTSGTTSLAPRIDNQSSFPVNLPSTSAVTTTTLSSTVTIINSIPTLAATTPTFVLSPVAIATVTSVPNLQRSLFVDTTTNQLSVVGCQSGIQDRVSNNIAPALITHSSDSSCSPNKPFRLKSDEDRVHYKEHRRVCHINAEQKRRCNIKNGFESLRHLLPSLNQNPNAKVSKAAMLQKGAEYIRALKLERQQQQEEAELLRQQRDNLNESISMFQKQLPATGAPIPSQRTNRMRELFDDYVRTQTLQNWKFWIFSLLMEPLLEAYNSSVSTGSIKELCETVLDWVNQHCSLVALRPGVLNSLRNLSTSTNILTDPTHLPEEATRAVTKKESGHH